MDVRSVNTVIIYNIYMTIFLIYELLMKWGIQEV